MITRLRDRTEAGQLLAARLKPYANQSDVLVLALPRGGVPVAFEVAKALGAPLDVFIVRKLGVPGHEELAMGAIASGGARVINEGVVRSLGIPDAAIERVATSEEREIERRERAYRGTRTRIDPAGKTIILVDDGLATGATVRAAVEALRSSGPARVVVAAGVGAADTCAALARVADECVCVIEPPDLHAISLWYEDFSQTEDEEVRDLLDEASRAPRPAARAEGATPSR
jgi:predicted phosphoribosyltransferase